MKHFITSTFNITPSDIESIHSIKDHNSLNFHITLKKKKIPCPSCGGHTVANGKRKKVIKHSAILDFDGHIIWYAHRYLCTDCGSTFTEPNPFSLDNLSSSIAINRAIMIDLKNLNLTYKDIAEKHHVSITTVQRYFDSWVNIPRQTLPESIGIDEIHSKMAKYGSSYLCVLVDNQNRSLFEVLPSRTKHHLNRYFEKIPQNEKDSVLYVTIDMWEPYRDVAKKHFKNCVIAVDPFHVVKHLSDSFTRIRLNIMNQVQYNSTTYYLLKKWHRLLESDVDLDNEPRYNHFFDRKLNYRDIYEMLLNINDELSCAYQLKESYRRFNKEATYDTAEERLDSLIDAFISADIPQYREFINLLHNWKEEILNSFLRPYDNRKLSNSLSENINGQIRSYLAVSKGVSNFPRFRKRIIYALNYRVFYSITSFLKSDKRQGKPRGKYKKK